MTNFSTHEDLARAQEVPGGSDRTFGLVFASFFLLLGVWPLVHRRPIRTWALGVAAALLVLSLVRPHVLAPLNRAWFRLRLRPQGIVSPVILDVLFLFVVTPIGFLMRLAGKNPLRLGFDPGTSSYRVERRPPRPASNRMRHQF